MSDLTIQGVMSFFYKNELHKKPEAAFEAVPNKICQLITPFSHVILFSSVKYERAFHGLRMMLGLPFFSVMNEDGKPVIVEIGGVKRLVVDFALESQLEELKIHYGNMLGIYLTTARIALNNRKSSRKS